MSGEMNMWIWDTMLSMTLLMGMVLIVRKPVAHFFGANISYLLWTLPLARLFMPTLTLTAPAPVEAVGPIASTIGVSDIAATVPTQEIAASAFASIDWLLIAAVIWVGGAGILFISRLASYFQFREDIVSDGQLVGRHGNIKILETAAVRGPLAFGLFQRYIAVPTDFFRNYAPRERELALDHEIAHHESGDLAANFIGLLILSLHWFNPVAWLAWMAFRQDQETACDARILQKSGSNVRAVYGRTIAKSVSSQRLGLASPLGQKNKIKDRLKMLGQSEKSTMRKRLGALMIGIGTVVALPLTATITYAEVEAEAEESHPHEGLEVISGGVTVDVGRNGVVVAKKSEDGYDYTIQNKRGSFQFQSNRKLSDKQIAKRVKHLDASSPDAPNLAIAPPIPPVAPSNPQEARSLSISSDGDTINITMLDGNKGHGSPGKYVHKVRHNGKTIILRTNRKLSEDDVREMVEEAEESRHEADQALREHRAERAQMKREMRQAERELQREMKEVEREVARSLRETKREIRDAQREAEREARRASRQTSSNWSIASQISTISFAPRAPRGPHAPRALTPTKATLFTIRNVNCKAIGKDLPFNSGHGVLIERAWAAVVDCSGVEPKKNRKKLLKMTLQVLQKSRSIAASCQDDGAVHTKKILVYDREIKHLKRKISRA